MRFCSIASGSNGNCYLVETGEHRLLLDIGLSAKTAEGMLRDKGIEPGTVTAVFVTHEHSDHTSGVGVWARRYKVPVLATAGTWKGMKKTVGEIPGELQFEIISGKGYRMSDLRIEAIPTSHDANDPCGYTVESEGRKVTVLTDTGFVTERMFRHLTESDLAVLESNHDIDMLMNGPYPMSLKQRIRGNHGHLSNQDCGRTLAHVRETNSGATFLLGHLSEENNTPELALKTVKDMVAGAGMPVGDIALTCRGRSTDLFRI
ncbi:MAG: MBL fold metallo-hydrolase [Lachnospiraceae bacterium]|nr:MBL fold metallo-hydrolase [Lachnospiraceae bacterium]